MQKFLVAILLASFAAPVAVRAEEQASSESRGFQIARRVALLELQKETPSRAAWLGSRVVANVRSLAYHREPKDTANEAKSSAPQKD